MLRVEVEVEVEVAVVVESGLTRICGEVAFEWRREAAPSLLRRVWLVACCSRRCIHNNLVGLCVRRGVVRRHPVF